MAEEQEKLYIKIEDGKTVDHPVLESNLRLFFPDASYDNVPEGWAKFTRVLQPVIGPFDVYEGVTYELINDTWQDVHHVRPMTEEEKSVAIQNFEDNVPPPYPSWILNKEKLMWEAPVPVPSDTSIFWYWNEATQEWLDTRTLLAQAANIDTSNMTLTMKGIIPDVGELDPAYPGSIGDLYSAGWDVYIWLGDPKYWFKLTMPH